VTVRLTIERLALEGFDFGARERALMVQALRSELELYLAARWPELVHGEVLAATAPAAIALTHDPVKLGTDVGRAVSGRIGG